MKAGANTISGNKLDKVATPFRSQTTGRSVIVFKLPTNPLKRGVTRRD